MAVRLAFLWLSIIFLVLISEGYGGPVKRGTATHPKNAKGTAHAPGANKALKSQLGHKANQTKLPGGHPTMPKKPHPVPKNNPPQFPAGHHPNKPKPKPHPVPKTNKTKGHPNNKPKKPQKPNPLLKSPNSASDQEQKVVVKKSLSRNKVMTVKKQPVNTGPQHNPVQPPHKFATQKSPPKKPMSKNHERKKPGLFMGRSFGTKEVPENKKLPEEHKRVRRSRPSSGFLQKKRNAEGAYGDELKSGMHNGNSFLFAYNSPATVGRIGHDDEMSIFDPAPGPYLADSDSDEDVTTEPPLTHRSVFKNWEEYLSAQRTKFSAGSGKTEIYKSSGYKPIMQPDEYFRYIDKLFKEKNDRVRAFHNLYLHMKEQNKKFKILEKPKTCGVYPC